MLFVQGVVIDHDLAARSMLDVGSYDVNGSVRPLFTGATVGVDMRDGPGVDIVAMSHDLPFADDAFAVVTCTELLEHDEAPWLTIAELKRVSSEWVIVTCRGFNAQGCFPLHEYPGDHWRLSESGMRLLLEHCGLTVDLVLPDPQAFGVFAVAHV